MKPNVKNKKSKALSAGAILITVMLAVSACSAGGNNGNDNAEPSATVEAPPVVSETPDAPATDTNGGVTEPGKATPDESAQPGDDNGGEDSGVGTAPDGAEPKNGEGVYVGQSDSHSVEIDTADGPQPFQFEDSLADAIAALPSDAKVTYEYVEKNIDVGGEKITQLWLTKIEESK